MKAVNCLPDDYKEYYSVDLQNNKKMTLILNVIAILIAVVMLVPMSLIIPLSTFFDISDGMIAYMSKTIFLIFLIILCCVLFTFVHSIAMKICGTKKIKYGFTGMYAYAGSDDYYGKKAYIFIALAPVVLCGIVIAIINCLVTLEWFWGIYFLQILNISSAVANFWVAIKFLRFPKDILVKDKGVSMTVYSKNEE